MSTLEIITFKPNNFRILLKFIDRIEFTSVTCGSKDNCLKIINLIQRSNSKSNAYQIKNLSCGSWCFFIKNPYTNEILGRSNTYLSKSITEEKLKEVRIHISEAIIDNKTYLRI